jgi:hypothetical protein
VNIIFVPTYDLFENAKICVGERERERERGERERERVREREIDTKLTHLYCILNRCLYYVFFSKRNKDTISNMIQNVIQIALGFFFFKNCTGTSGFSFSNYGCAHSGRDSASSHHDAPVNSSTLYVIERYQNTFATASVIGWHIFRNTIF